MQVSNCLLLQIVGIHSVPHHIFRDLRVYYYNSPSVQLKAGGTGDLGRFAAGQQQDKGFNSAVVNRLILWHKC
jgi:hypothetical protein